MNSLRQITLLAPKDRRINLENPEGDGLMLEFSDDANSVDISIDNNRPSLVVIDLGAFWAYQCTAIIQKCYEYQIVKSVKCCMDQQTKSK